MLGSEFGRAEEPVSLKAGDAELVGETVAGEGAWVLWTLVELS